MKSYKQFIESIQKSVHYAHVDTNHKVTAKGSARDMHKIRKKKGGRVWNSHLARVGDTLK